MWKKDLSQVCPEILYEEGNDGIVITGCKSMDGYLILPDEVEGRKVVEIGPYAFSKWEEKPESKLWRNPRNSGREDIFPIHLDKVKEVWLPYHVREIGKYAFYRCRNLKKLILSNSLKGIGGGVFTGCRLSEVELYCHNGEESCLKSILDDIRFCMEVKFHYEIEGNYQEARVIFPEHYEEDVENTPARILEIKHHGAGGYYRQCFFERKLDYGKYDKAFLHTRAEEDAKIGTKLAFYRLHYPYQLREEGRKEYLHYLNKHYLSALAWIMEEENREGVAYLVEALNWSKEMNEEGIELAGRMGRLDVVSFLMERRQKEEKPISVSKRFQL